MKKFAILLVSLLLMLAGCGNDNNNENTDEADSTISIKTTVYPLAYFAERIGGEAVNVSSIYPPGSDSHTFEPTQKAMIELADSDLFLYIGLGLEGFVDNAQKTLEGEHVRFVAASDQIPDEELLQGHSHSDREQGDGHEGHDHSGVDPHVWLSPTLAGQLALTVKDALVNERPELEEDFNKRYEELSAELERLGGDYRTMAEQAEYKTFFVSHSSFSYIADEYGLEQVSVAGLNPQSEPSQKELARIVDLAREKQVKTIFFEQNISSKLSEVIRKEIGAESAVLHNLSVLSQEDIQNGENYFSLMERNLERLSGSLNE